MHPVGGDEGPQPALLAGGGDRADRGRRDRLPGLLVGDELDGPEDPEPADLADAGVLGGDLLQSGPDRLRAEGAHVLEDALVLEDLHRGDRGGAGKRVAGVGEPAGVGTVVEGGGDLRGDDDAAERHVAGVDPLREGDEVGDDAPPVDGEPLAAPAEAGHDLVGDHDDAVLVADLADPGEVAVRGRDHPVGADDGLQDDRSDVLRALGGDGVAQVRQRALALLLLGLGVEGAAVEVGAPEAHHPGHAGLGGPPAGLAGERDRAGGGPVIAAVGGEDLVPAGVHPGHPQRVLVGLGAAVGEEDLGQVAGGALGDHPGGLRAHVVGGGRRDGGQARGLLLDGGDHPRVLVPDVDVHQLAGEVEIPPPGVVGDVAAAGRHDHRRVDLRLGRPGVEDVGAVVAAGLLVRHGARLRPRPVPG